MEGKQEAKRVKLTIPQQNQGATPVDPKNTAGKCSELEPIPGGEITNLPNKSGTEAGTSAAPGGSAPNPVKLHVQDENEENSGDVSMGEGNDNEADSGEENDDEDPTQVEANWLHLEVKVKRPIVK